jgi:heat shock protein HtpX
MTRKSIFQKHGFANRQLSGVKSISRLLLVGRISGKMNWDTLTTTIVATVAGAITYLAQWGWLFGGAFGYSGGYGGRNRQQRNIISLLLMMMLAPLAAMLVQLAVSRTREYSADEGGAKREAMQLESL